MPAKKLSQAKMQLKAQLVALDKQIRQSKKSKAIKKKPPLPRLKGMSDLHKHRHVIMRKAKSIPPALFLIDPVRALGELGFTLTPGMKKKLVLVAGIRPPKDRSLYDAVKKGSAKITGVKKISISSR